MISNRLVRLHYFSTISSGSLAFGERDGIKFIEGSVLDNVFMQF